MLTALECWVGGECFLKKRCARRVEVIESYAHGRLEAGCAVGKPLATDGEGKFFWGGPREAAGQRIELRNPVKIIQSPHFPSQSTLLLQLQTAPLQLRFLPVPEESRFA
jgi:hypothetical protein